MSDLDRFIELYRSLDIECIVFEEQRLSTWKNGGIPTKRIRIGNFEYDIDPGRDSKSDKFDGYGGFYSEIIFDMDGKFIKQTFYE